MRSTRLADESVRVVVLTGTGSAFSAGFDLSEFADPDPEHQRRLWDSSDRFHHTVLRFPLPSWRLSMARHWRVDSTLPCWPTCGWRPTWRSSRTSSTRSVTSCTARCRDLVGGSVARDLVLTGRRIEAGEALAVGLVNRVVPAADLLETAVGVAADIARAPRVPGPHQGQDHRRRRHQRDPAHPRPLTVCSLDPPLASSSEQTVRGRRPSRRAARSAAGDRRAVAVRHRDVVAHELEVEVHRARGRSAPSRRRCRCGCTRRRARRLATATCGGRPPRPSVPSRPRRATAHASPTRRAHPPQPCHPASPTPAAAPPRRSPGGMPPPTPGTPASADGRARAPTTSPPDTRRRTRTGRSRRSAGTSAAAASRCAA